MAGWAWLRVGAIVGVLAVALGAFGAHGLKERLDASKMTATFQTAAHYQMDHALALAAVGLAGVARRPGRALDVAGWSFLVGVILFSGSLYALAVTGITRLGMITPLGGVALIVGWSALAVAATGRGEMSLRDRAAEPACEPAAAGNDF